MMLPNSRTFILGMPRRKEKRATTIAHLNSHGITPEVFDGVDYEISGLFTGNCYDHDNPGSGFKIGWKLTNLYLSHWLCWNACLHLNADHFVFFEDDVRFDYDWKPRFAEAWKDIPKDFDVLYLGSCCVMGQPGAHPISRVLWEIRIAMCCHAYVVSKRALPILIDACRKIFAPIDVAIITEIPVPLKRYAIMPRLCSQFETVIPE